MLALLLAISDYISSVYALMMRAGPSERESTACFASTTRQNLCLPSAHLRSLAIKATLTDRVIEGNNSLNDPSSKCYSVSSRRPH